MKKKQANKLTTFIYFTFFSLSLRSKNEYVWYFVDLGVAGNALNRSTLARMNYAGPFVSLININFLNGKFVVLWNKNFF